MNQSNLPLAITFKKFRDQPKWFINMLLVIIIGIGLSWVSIKATDINATFEDAGLSKSELEAMSAFTAAFTYVGSVIGFILTIIVLFIVLLIISKIMKSDVKVSSLFAASTFMTLITVIFDFIVMTIQAIAGLDPFKYSITSLKIFDQDNAYLDIINLKTFLSSYLFIIALYSTSLLKGKTSIIWGILYFIVLIIFGVAQASLYAS